jgi:hypothetical protein
VKNFGLFYKRLRSFPVLRLAKNATFLNVSSSFSGACERLFEPVEGMKGG